MNAPRRTRPESEAIAAALRADGLKLREIAERMGVAIPTVDAWINDPGGARLRARKDSYRGVCKDCGRPTDGSNGADQAPTRCLACITWTREEILRAITAWADDNDGGVPHPETVRKHFGSWNAALLAAGLELHCGRRPETWEAMREALERGDAVSDIAARFGVTREAIYMRLRVRGLKMADVRGKAAA
jgi:transcriptional regulator with XRE-family HTH domain